MGPAQCQDFQRRSKQPRGWRSSKVGSGMPTGGNGATERKEPLKDVPAAGGWNEVTTLLTCYQHADEARCLKVIESPAGLVSRRAAGALEKR